MSARSLPRASGREMRKGSLRSGVEFGDSGFAVSADDAVQCGIEQGLPLGVAFRQRLSHTPRVNHDLTPLCPSVRTGSPLKQIVDLVIEFVEPEGFLQDMT